MKTERIKTGIIILLLACLGLLATCEFSKEPISENTPLQDTIFLSQWRREKQEKLDMIASYEKELSRLQHDNDSMQVLVTETKLSVSAYRFKAKHFESQLKNAIKTLVTKDTTLKADTISPILDSLVLTRDSIDAACDSTVSLLENMVANRDSSVLFHRQIEDNLRDLNKEQELRNQILTEQLNLAFKNQRKKARQNKILAGGLLILSGITTSILLTNSLK
ncbi:MAG: hypothetical protein JNL60_10460 [Bacteroidia bacterium]|nr:hypothetical protein [Bacteroidia bacterium]